MAYEIMNATVIFNEIHFRGFLFLFGTVKFMFGAVFLSIDESLMHQIPFGTPKSSFVTLKFHFATVNFMKITNTTVKITLGAFFFCLGQ